MQFFLFAYEGLIVKEQCLPYRHHVLANKGWGAHGPHSVALHLSVPWDIFYLTAPLHFIQGILASTMDCKEKLIYNKDIRNEVKYEKLIALLLGSLKCPTKFW